MIGVRTAFAALLLSLAAGASSAPDQGLSPEPEPAPAAASAPEPARDPRDRYLGERYVVEIPAGLPNEAQVASGCGSAVADAIGEMEAGGAIVDPTYDSFAVRNLSCAWTAGDPRIAQCHFQLASVPFMIGQEPGGEAAYLRRLRARDWLDAGGRFALVRWRNPALSRIEPRWIATDTCRPFVFDLGQGLVIDPRGAARNDSATAD